MLIEEVHLWRGTSAERALRSKLVKSSQFAYFDAQLEHPDWREKKVFDFGGNKGNFLRDPACAVRHENYYCLDVLREAIDEGRAEFPEAHFVHYDRYNRSFNPEGKVGLPVPDLNVRFDFILAYSVFTHTSLEETTDLVRQLEGFLAPGGTLAFTFIDPHWQGNLRWRLGRNEVANIDHHVAAAAKADWCSLINGDELYINSAGPRITGEDLYINSAGPRITGDEHCTTYNVYYTEGFLRQQFPSAIVHSPVNGEMQHCAILRKQ